MKKYLGQCRTIREKKAWGEEFWQHITNPKNHTRISMYDFERNCDLSEFLEDGETLEDVVRADPTSYYAMGYYKGIVYYIIFTHGFEFFWN